MPPILRGSRRLKKIDDKVLGESQMSNSLPPLKRACGTVRGTVKCYNRYWHGSVDRVPPVGVRIVYGRN
jgi:hypothetical protein